MRVIKETWQGLQFMIVFGFWPRRDDPAREEQVQVWVTLEELVEKVENSKQSLEQLCSVEEPGSWKVCIRANDFVNKESHLRSSLALAHRFGYSP